MSKTIIIPQNSEYIRVFSKPDAIEKEKPVTGQRKGKNPLSIRGQDAQEALKGRDPQYGPGRAYQTKSKSYRQQFPGVGGTNQPTFDSLPTKIMRDAKIDKMRKMRVRSRKPGSMMNKEAKAKDRVFTLNEGLTKTSGARKQRYRK